MIKTRLRGFREKRSCFKGTYSSSLSHNEEGENERRTQLEAIQKAVKR